MATSCPKGFYERNGRCLKSIHTSPEKKGTYGKGFEDLSQEQQYTKIDEVAKTESPQTLHRQISAMDSFAYSNPTRREKLQKDLIYSKEKYPTPERRDPPKDHRGDPPGRSSNLEWDEKNRQYDIEHNDPSGARWAKEREDFELKKGQKGGDTMAKSCGKDQTWVEGYTKTDGTEVDGYCRDLPHDTPADRAEFRKMGKENGPKARNWEDKRH